MKPILNIAEKIEQERTEQFLAEYKSLCEKHGRILIAAAQQQIAILPGRELIKNVDQPVANPNTDKPVDK